MSTRVWDAHISEQDKVVYQRLKMGAARTGFGVKPAVLVIDVQYRTVGDKPAPLLESMEKYYPLSCGQAGWDAVHAIAQLLDVARPKNVPILYPYVAPKKEQDRGRMGQKIQALIGVPDRGYDFVDKVAPNDGDYLLPKRHASAFFGTPLVSYLNDLRVDTLILTGCTTSGCVRATAIDSTSYNFRVIVPEECVYDRQEVSHAVNLWDINAKYGDVISLEETTTYLTTLKPSLVSSAP